MLKNKQLGFTMPYKFKLIDCVILFSHLCLKKISNLWGPNFDPQNRVLFYIRDNNIGYGAYFECFFLTVGTKYLVFN